MIADQRHVSPNYFRDDEHPAGRKAALFPPTDDSRGEPVVIINRAMAKQYLPDENPIDRRVRIGLDPNVWLRIVGVVEDVQHVSLSRDPVTEMYRPIAQTATPLFTLVIRTDRDPAAFAPAARAAVQAIDPNLPIYDVRTMEDRIAGSFAQTRGTMLLLLVTACWPRRCPAWRSTDRSGTPSASGSRRSACVWHWAPAAGRCSVMCCAGR